MEVEKDKITFSAERNNPTPQKKVNSKYHKKEYARILCFPVEFVESLLKHAKSFQIFFIWIWKMLGYLRKYVFLFLLKGSLFFFLFSNKNRKYLGLVCMVIF